MERTGIEPVCKVLETSALAIMLPPPVFIKNAPL